jgi:phage tail-like protein
MAEGRYDQKNDFYHSFRFVVTDTAGYIQSSIIAGFTNCSLPEHNIDHLEYSEGLWTYSKWYPGRSTFSTVTLSRGVVRNYSKFADWILNCAEGRNYRTDVTIAHIHRADVEGMAPEFSPDTMKRSRKIVLKNCLPIRFRPGHDFDATASDISIQEIEFQPESFKVFAAEPGTEAPGA